MSDRSSFSPAILASIVRACTLAGVGIDEHGAGHLVCSAAAGLGPIQVVLDRDMPPLVLLRMTTEITPLMAISLRREQEYLLALWLSGVLAQGRCVLDAAGRTVLLQVDLAVKPGDLEAEMAARIHQLRREVARCAPMFAAVAGGQAARVAVARCNDISEGWV